MDLKYTNNDSNSNENEIFTIRKENISLLEKEIIFFKNQKRTFIKSKLDRITNKQEFSVKDFFRLIKIGVEEILGVKLNYRILSADYLAKKNPKTNKGSKWYANDRILESLRFEDYALSTASLNQFKRNLNEIFNEKSAYFEYLIELYKLVNPWSYKFSEQKKIIIDYFKSINTLEKAYWLGFLLAEASIKIRGNNKMFSMTLSALDLNHLIKFCKVIGIDFRKLRLDRTIGKYGQILRRFSISFSNVEFCDNLIKNGFPKNGLTSDNLNLRFPYWVFTDKRFAMAMLLGFFDGDGSHGLEFPNMRKKGEKNLSPIIRIKSKQCLEDIKEYFNIKSDVNTRGNNFELILDRELFNELLLNLNESLERKRYKYIIEEPKFMFSKEQLKKFYDNGLSDQKIADNHLAKFGIKISDSLVWSYAKEWNLQKSTNPIARWRNCIELLGKGWSLEDIYVKKFGYTFKPEYHWLYQKRIINHFKEWFAHDSAVKDSNGDVSLQKIIDVYGGKLENNLFVMTERERVILRKKEGWSLEKIYMKELGYQYDPSKDKSVSYMRQIFKNIFKNDLLIMNYEDILKGIDEVYKPSNKL